MEEKAKLEEAKQAVKQQAFFMKRSLDSRNLRVALQHASTMLGELRTSSLGPKSYYELYIAVTDELRHMEQFFVSEHKGGRRMQELYELVQHAGNVLPRLYLLLAVGSVYIQSKEAPAKDVLKDLVEMCKGVQHPMRGLFLRNYLSQTSKDKLPDVGSPYEGPGGTTADAVSFILSNFGEMNTLWVRMQHQGPIREKEKRERERSELQILVGTNLVRLSQLEGVTLEVYSNTVLPTVLEKVVNCKDAIAQQYLMDCITQVFPVEYHIATLPVFLKHCGWLSAATDVNHVLLSLMDRLSVHVPEPDEVEEASIFTPVSEHVASVASKAEPEEKEEMLQLYKGLVRLALRVYPSRLSYMDHTFSLCTELLDKGPPLRGAKAHTLLRELSMQPLEWHKDVLVPLELASWPRLCSHLPYQDQKQVVGMLVEKVTDQGCVVDNVGKADSLLTFVAPLLRQPPGEAGAEEADAPVDEDLALELAPVSRMMHAMQHSNTDELGRILNMTYKHAAAADARRSPFTLVPLVFRCLQLARRIAVVTAAGEVELEVSCHKLLAFIGRMVEGVKSLAPALALRLYLQAAQTADQCGEEADAYEFFTQAFVVYEEDLPDSRAQLAAITLVSSTLTSLTSFSSEHYETLATSTTQYSAKLLKKPDQSRAVCLSSKLFWPMANEDNRNPKRVLECLQRALKIADACKVSNMHTPLFIEIFESYLWHYEQRNENVTCTYLTSLMQLIEQHLSEEESTEAAPAAHRVRYTNAKAHITRKINEGDERYQELAA